MVLGTTVKYIESMDTRAEHDGCPYMRLRCGRPGIEHMAA